jgi:hypothetical protein
MKKYNITKKFLIKQYLTLQKSTHEIAKQIGCCQALIWNYLVKFSIKTRNQGAFVKGKHFTKIHCQRISEALKDNPKLKHRTPFWQGKKLSREHRAKMSETRIKLGLSKGINNPRFGKLALHGRKIKYKDMWMRSSWEVAYAKYLDKQGTKWLYESKTFNLGGCTYTPDFYLSEIDTYIEIKGWWRDNAKNKFYLFKEKYPNVKLKLLQRQELKIEGIIK